MEGTAINVPTIEVRSALAPKGCRMVGGVRSVRSELVIVDERRESKPGTFMYSILNVCGFTIENSPRDHERGWLVGEETEGILWVEHRSWGGIIRHGEKEREREREREDGGSDGMEKKERERERENDFWVKRRQIRLNI